MEAASRPFSAAYLAARSDEATTRATPADAFRAARRRWLSGERIDMNALATALGISRPTLYKWCGQREQLLTDVIWSVFESEWDRVIADTEHLRGADRVVEAHRRFIAGAAASEALTAYLRNETHAALRALTVPGGFEARLVARLTEFLRDAVRDGQLELRADPEVIAYALVRLTEAILYNDAIASLEPRLDLAPEVSRLLVS